MWESALQEWTADVDVEEEEDGSPSTCNTRKDRFDFLKYFKQSTLGTKGFIAILLVSSCCAGLVELLSVLMNCLAQKGKCR